MKIKSIIIKSYKKFQDKNIEFGKLGLESNLSDIYNNTNITALIGENGSGKTTVLSFIAIIFRYIEREQGKIPSDFELKYELNNQLIIITKEFESIFIIINNKKKLVLETKRKNGKSVYERKSFQLHLPNEDVAYPEIKKYLPSNVVVFGQDIEYKINYPNNLICDRIVKINDNNYISSMNGSYLNKGIIDFFEKYFSESNKLMDTFSKMNISILPIIKLRIADIFLSEKEFIYSECTEIDHDYYIKDVADNNDEFILKLTKYCEKNRLVLKDILLSISNKTCFDDFVSFRCEDNFNLEINIENMIKRGGNSYELLRILLEYNKSYINDIYIGDKYSIKMMSSGEKMIFSKLFFMLTHIDNNSILIFEEPEIHLNYLWAKQLIPILINCLKGSEVHIFLSSHNFYFINCLQKEQILVLKNNEIKMPVNNTFLAIDEEIIKEIGTITNSSNIFEEDIFKAINDSDIEKLEVYFSVLGESYLKIIVFKKLVDLGVICGK